MRRIEVKLEYYGCSKIIPPPFGSVTKKRKSQLKLCHGLTRWRIAWREQFLI